MFKDKYILTGLQETIEIHRDDQGVPLIRAGGWKDAFYGLGWIHGRDRGGQVAITRLVAGGRLCEILQDNPAFLALDRYYRKWGFVRHARRFIDTLDPASRACVEAYCQGLNRAWEQRRPGILRLFRYRPEPYTAADVLAFIKLLSFASLAEAQRIVELFIIQAVQRGVDEKRLQELLPALDNLNPDLIRNLREVPELFPTRWQLFDQPPGTGSNSWVVAGIRTESGAPILCNDPHLEVNRLPAVMCEAQLQVGDEWVHGGTIPGIPGMLSGRNRDLAWGVTYACADSADFFVERCRQGCYQREGQWFPFREQREQIHRKGHSPVELLVYENEHGILEGDPHQEGDYLSWGWCGLGPGGVGTIKAFLRLLRCQSVEEGQQSLRDAEIPSLHVTLADRFGNIGYQMMGQVPRRRADWSGLAPVAGWDTSNDWQGWLDPATEIPAFLNPLQGFIVTANEGRRHPDGPLIATVPQPSYRQARIEELITAQSRLGLRDMQAIQYDVLSRQARRLLPLFLPRVPAGSQREMLEQWDYRYTPESRAAPLFENIYHSVLLKVFGERGLGREWMHHLLTETLLSVLLFGFFDDVLCQADSTWLPARQRDEMLSSAVREGLQQPVRTWGKFNEVSFQNIFFGGRLPRLLGFDPGPYAIPGGRATVRQGSQIRHAGRDTFCAPAYHLVTDLSTDESWTNLPGGPSESRFSRYYTNELVRWLSGKYKKLRIDQ